MYEGPDEKADYTGHDQKNGAPEKDEEERVDHVSIFHRDHDDG
jgi:hypothetical protein